MLDTICPMCGRAYATDEHHLIFGSSLRRLAEEDNLKIKLCRDCHTSGELNKRIHDNIAAERLSKMLGQAMYENKKLAEGMTLELAREDFINRYGLSYL